MGGDFADQQLAVEHRDDRAGGREKPRVRNACPPAEREAQDKRARLELALTQHLTDIAHRENAEKTPDARTDLELGPRVLVELRDFSDRHLRFPGEALEGPLLMRCCVHLPAPMRISAPSSQLETASMATPVTESAMAIARLGSPRRSQMFTA